MVTISGWLFIPVAAVAVVALFGWVRAINRAQDTVSRILAEELRRPPVNDQAADDAAERGQA